jgi:hypothetical protein
MGGITPVFLGDAGVDQVLGRRHHNRLVTPGCRRRRDRVTMSNDKESEKRDR